VQTYENLSAILYLFIAAIESPPPITENASRPAIKLKSSFVPVAVKLSSNMPQGPFTKTVFASFNIFLYSSIVF
jgi:hypothetical protein